MHRVGSTIKGALIKSQMRALLCRVAQTHGSWPPPALAALGGIVPTGSGATLIARLDQCFFESTRTPAAASRSGTLLARARLTTINHRSTTSRRLHMKIRTTAMRSLACALLLSPLYAFGTLLTF